MTTTTTHWTKQKAGFYTLDGTDYAVASMQVTTEEDTFGAAVEWAVIHFTNPTQRGSQDGENVDWFDTMREARAYAEKLTH